jgi:hypothetical protein
VSTLSIWTPRNLSYDALIRESFPPGLGDIFFEPEVITGGDLVAFSLLFLVGFVYMSAFLGKCADFLSPSMSKKKPIFELLVERFSATKPREYKDVVTIPVVEGAKHGPAKLRRVKSSTF